MKWNKNEIRYNYCLHIGEAWLKILERIREENPDEDLDGYTSELYKVLDKCTLVGELVGIDSIQQILKYPSKSLIFSSLIENDKADETWMPPEKLMDFGRKWNLNCIPIKRVGIYNSHQDLKENMLELYNKITSGPICEYEEGAIMMLVLRNPNSPEKDRVLSCSKIKTIEYKVFKKIKDKLK